MLDHGNFEGEHQWSVKDLRLIKRLLHYCKNHKLGLTGAVVLSLIITGGGLILPLLMQIGIDSFITVSNLARQDCITGLSHMAFWFGLFSGVVFTAGLLQIILLEWIGQDIMQRLRQDLFHHLLRLDLIFFYNQPTGRLVTRLTNDIQNLHEMFTSVVISLFNDLLKFVGIFCALFLMNFRLASAMSVFIPLASVVIIVFARLARKKSRSICAQLAKLNSFLSESIGGMAVIQVFNIQQIWKNRYYALAQEYLRRTMGQICLFGTFVPLTEFISTAAIAMLLWYGGGQVIQNQLSLGELVAFLAYMRIFFQPLSLFSQKYSIVQSAMASAERVFQLLDTRVSKRQSRPLLITPAVEGKIKFEGVSFGYDKNKAVVRDINLEIIPGETVAIVGYTGTGKTTLISLLSRFFDPDCGSIFLDGVNIRHFSVKQLRQRIGVITQDIFILPGTVRSNITLDRPHEESKLSAILKQTGVDALIRKLPLGLDTIIGDGGLNLSIGEKQLLSFVRVLYREPLVLVLDEATASIDSETEKMLERAVTTGIENKTSIVIAHRLSTIRRANRIAVMNDGCINEVGTHEELMAGGGIYKQLIELDFFGNGTLH